jgi:hypothetical protein
LFADRALSCLVAFVAEGVFCKLGCGVGLAFEDEGMLSF